MERAELKSRAIRLRLAGYTYSEMCDLLKVSIPKSTLSGWLQGLSLQSLAVQRLAEKQKQQLTKTRQLAVDSNRETRILYLTKIKEKNSIYSNMLSEPHKAKIALAVLYLAEGRKDPRDGLKLGNSNPDIISLYLKLLDSCYTIDYKKFRCRIQCRADQEISSLEKFWSDWTKIPHSQFYPTYIDQRTVGKPTTKAGYMGVCVITYLSNETALDIIAAGQSIMGR